MSTATHACACGKLEHLRNSEHGPICYSCMQQHGLTECDGCHVASRGPFTKERVSGMGSSETYSYCAQCGDYPRHERYSLAEDVTGLHVTVPIGLGRLIN